MRLSPEFTCHLWGGTGVTNTVFLREHFPFGCQVTSCYPWSFDILTENKMSKDCRAKSKSRIRDFMGMSLKEDWSFGWVEIGKGCPRCYYTFRRARIKYCYAHNQLSSKHRHCCNNWRWAPYIHLLMGIHLLLVIFIKTRIEDWLSNLQVIVCVTNIGVVFVDLFS